MPVWGADDAGFADGSGGHGSSSHGSGDHGSSGQVFGDPGPEDASAAQLRSRLNDLCVTAVSYLGMAGGYVTVSASAVDHVVVAASDAGCWRLGEAHSVAGEGPANDAFAGARPVFVADLADEEWRGRWPGYTEMAASAGLCSVGALPLQIGASRLGVLVLYARAPSRLVAEGGREALAFADRATELLLDSLTTPVAWGDTARMGVPSMAQIAAGGDEGLDGTPSSPVEALFSAGLENRGQLYQAQGMVMADLRISLVEALARMRAYAFAHELTLRGVAELVVARRLRMTNDVEDRD